MADASVQFGFNIQNMQQRNHEFSAKITCELLLKRLNY